LPCIQIGDDGQEDPMELEKKEELGEEANLKNKRQSTAYRRSSTGPVDSKIQRKNYVSDFRQAKDLSIGACQQA